MTAERRYGPQRGVRTQPTWSPVSGQPRSNSVTTITSTTHNNNNINTQQQHTVTSDMDLQIKENDDKEAGKMNYGTNFNNFIKVRIS